MGARNLDKREKMAKRKSRVDPRAAEEAKKYDNPIPSREHILTVLEEIGEPLLHEELADELALTEVEQREALLWRLLAMVRDGQLVRMRSEKFGLIDKLNLIRGYVIGSPDGHGFLVPDEGGSDLFLSHRQMQQVFDGDQVLARVTRVRRGGDRREAAIARVIKRRHKQVTGRYFHESGIGFVVPDNKRLTQDIIVPDSESHDAEMGEVVSVEITSYPTLRTQAVGRVVEVLGGHMEPGMETDIAVRSHDIPHVWPDEITTELAKIPDKVRPRDRSGREDLRQLPFVTIDGEDARDFDDAVYCEPRRGGWTLYVAIADVSHYVKLGSILDKEAFNRGNSTYFPSRVVPMLPEELSNGLCSLKPKVDRLVFVCEMKVTKAGKVTRSKFYEAVIHSHARLTYKQVASWIEGSEPAKPEVYPYVIELYQLYQALHAYRQEQGVIDFDLSEPKVIFDENKKIEALVPLVRNEAHRLIEECMLAANVEAAKLFIKKKFPSLFRVHPGPKPEKLEDLLTFLGEIGLRLPGRLTPTAKDYADVLARIDDRPDRHLIQMVLLRSLMQAQYSTNNAGHFGLAFDAYTHFTSPIRRYPDLLVHRSIKLLLAQQKPSEEFKQLLVNAASHCSMTERRSDEASRDVMDWLKCEFMLDKQGEVFSGVISSVVGFGLFVELEDIYVEGLVHISELRNDYYQFDSIHHRLVAEGSGKVYRIGDRVTVRVARVDLEQRRIDFELIEKPSKSKKKSKKKK